MRVPALLLPPQLGRSSLGRHIVTAIYTPPPVPTRMAQPQPKSADMRARAVIGRRSLAHAKDSRLLNVVLHGNSILEGSGVATQDKPLALIAAGKPTAIVVQGTMGGDIVTIRGNVASVTSQFVVGRLNIAVLLESNNYLNDTRGEAAFGGDGLTLSDPAAAAQACYDESALWANSVIAAGFLAMAVTSPASYETTASPLSNNTSYNSARLSFNTLLRTNPAKFPYVADAAADSRLQTSSDTTYYDGSQIHLTAAGYSVLSDIIIAALP